MYAPLHTEDMPWLYMPVLEDIWPVRRTYELKNKVNGTDHAECGVGRLPDHSKQVKAYAENALP